MADSNTDLATPPMASVGSMSTRLAHVRFVLVETSHPGNIGAVARAMKTMGLSDLRLVAPARFPAAEATARASGADDLLANAQCHDTLVEAISDCAIAIGTSVRSRHIDWPHVGPRECASEVVSPRIGPVAFVFGRENSGLSNQELDYCTRLMTIPTEPDFSSLNVASAAQIVAHELRMELIAQAGVAPALKPEPSKGTSSATDREDLAEPLASPAGRGPSDPLASSAQMEGFYGHLERALVKTGYLDPDAPRLLMRRMRRLFGRAGVVRSELNILRGILSSIDGASKRNED